MGSLAEWQVGAEQIVPLDTQGFVPVMETITSPAMGTYEQTAEYEQRQIYLAEQEAIELEKQRLRQFEANQQALVDYNLALAEQQETTFLEDLAQEYVDFYEGDSTTAEFITDPIGTTTGGTVDLITDVVGTDVIVGSIGAVGDVIAPITEPIGESAAKYLVPVAILGGAYLLLK